MHPDKDPARSIDLKQLVDTWCCAASRCPILIRFAEILKHRLGEMHEAFRQRHRRAQLSGHATAASIPIKVNQQRQVVEEVLEFGRPYKFGLEAGSKPELLAVMALADNETPIICNGFKDDEYIEMAMLAQKIGRNIMPVVEKYTELDLILKHAQRRRRAAARSGMRVKLASRGVGPLEVVGRLPLEIRPDRHRGGARARAAEGSSAWPTASSCCTSTWAARSPTSARSRAR